MESKFQKKVVCLERKFDVGFSEHVVDSFFELSEKG